MESASKTSGPPHASSWAAPPEFYADENVVTKSVVRLLRNLGYMLHTPSELFGSRAKPKEPTTMSGSHALARTDGHACPATRRFLRGKTS
jgi:hypothetical protein